MRFSWSNNVLLTSCQQRTLEELKQSTEILRGQESMRLRTFCSNTLMIPARDLDDDYGHFLLQGSLEFILLDYTKRLDEKPDTMSADAKMAAVAQDLSEIRWGPTAVPLYNVLGLLSQIVPELRSEYIRIAEFYIKFNVPVNGKDLSGTTALSHSFSTKRSFDLEYAQILYDAGGDINNRNRYGAVVAHEIVLVYDPSDRTVVAKATKSLEWFLTHGGSVDIADGDGITPRSICDKLQRPIPAFKKLVEQEDERRKLKGPSRCLLCGTDQGKLLSCGKCKKAKYCSPQLRGCQKWDWPRHKKQCVP